MRCTNVEADAAPDNDRTLKEIRWKLERLLP
jgi:hypothetical protein